MFRALVVKLVFLLAFISEPMQPVWPVAGFPLLSVCLDSASSLHLSSLQFVQTVYISPLGVV